MQETSRVATAVSPRLLGVVGELVVAENVVPSFAKEGWTRPKERCCEASFDRSGRGSCFSYRSFIPNDFDNRLLETTTPSAPAKERAIFLMAQPPLLREGGDYAFLTRDVEQQFLKAGRRLPSLRGSIRMRFAQQSDAKRASRVWRCRVSSICPGACCA